MGSLARVTIPTKEPNKKVMMESYMVVTLDKKRTFFNETNTCVGTTFLECSKCGEMTGESVYIYTYEELKIQK